jgi:hypothetical protein
MHNKNRYMCLISWIQPRGSETILMTLFWTLSRASLCLANHGISAWWGKKVLLPSGGGGRY